MSRLKFQVGDYGKLDYFEDDKSFVIFRVTELKQTEKETTYGILLMKMINWDGMEKGKKYELKTGDDFLHRCRRIKKQKELVVEML